MVEQIVITQEERERERERAIRVVGLVLGIGNLSRDGLVVSSL